VTPIGIDEVCIVLMAEHTKDTSFDAALQDLPELRRYLAAPRSALGSEAQSLAFARSITCSEGMLL